MPKVDRSDLEGPKIDRRTATKLFSLAGFSGIASLAGCSGEDGGSGGDGGGGTAGGGSDGGDGGTTQTETPSTGSQGGSVEAALAGIDQVAHLNPHRINQAFEVQVASNIFSALLKLNDNAEIVGDLATDWTIPDNTTYEFTIAEGVTFHNGDTLDSEAIKWSIESLMENDASPRQGNTSAIESIEAPDPTSLTISLSQPQAPFISFLTRGVGRVSTVINQTAYEEDPEEYDRMPVGSGPFEITNRDSGSSITLEAYDDYWETDSDGNQLPYLDQVTFNIVPEATTAWNAVRSGSMHYSDNMPPQQAQQAEQAPNISVRNVSTATWHCLAPLCVKPHEHPEWARRASGSEEITDKWEGTDLPTTDARVRRAISLAINRTEIVERAYFGTAREAHQLYNYQVGWLPHDEMPQQQHDPEQAEQLLEEAGYTGEPRVSMSLLAPTGWEREATVLQAQLSNVGIDLELNVVQFSEFYDLLYAYTHELVIAYGAQDMDPWMSHWKQLHTPTGENNKGVWQKGLYSNEEFDQLMQEDFSQAAPEDRVPILKDMMEIFVEDAPYAMTAFLREVRPYSDSLSGFETPVGQSNFHYASLEQ
ncbi:ABC transporter substrate-binding protein [Salinirarus marinus]|uniref:ABC transporter substrate-binding protein n=1 Tax=Salinirarus marinus TaxID=3068310 RepID=UPI003C6BF1A5